MAKRKGKQAAPAVADNLLREKKVDAESIAYGRMKLEWPIIEDLCAGTARMREAGEKWAPKRMREPELFYKARLRSTFLYGALRDTVEAIVAKPFSQPITIKGTLPEPLASMVDDIDGQGTTLTEFATEVYRVGWRYGLCHIVIDYPNVPAVEESLSDGGSGDEITPDSNLAVEREQGIRPTFGVVTPRAMLGWRKRKVGGRIELDEVRFKECEVEHVEGTFADEVEVERVRVIQRDRWMLFEQESNGSSASNIWVGTSGTSTLGEVPISTFYVSQTGFMEAAPPLLDLAYLNAAHWQSSSLQRNSLDVARIPILVKLGFSQESDTDGEPSGTVVSSNVAFESRDTNAKAFYCEHSGAALKAGAEDLATLREQMQVLGLQPWMQRGDTATGVASNDEKSESAVQRSVRALELALHRAFEIAAKWAKVELPEDFAIDVFDDFGLAPSRAQDVASLIQMRQQRMISHETFLEEIKRRAVLSEEVDVEEEIQRTKDEGEALGTMMPLGFGPPGMQQGDPNADQQDDGDGADAEDNADDEEDAKATNSRVPRQFGPKA